MKPRKAAKPELTKAAEDTTLGALLAQHKSDFPKSSGLEKEASVVRDRLLQGTLAVATSLGYGLTAGGTGLLLRARLEDKFKNEREKTTADHLIAKAPLIGAGLGVLIGTRSGLAAANKLLVRDKRQVANRARRIRKDEEAWRKRLQQMGKENFNKESALNPDLKLMDHQERFIDRLVDNNGVMMAAHATGSGKTLSAIAGFERLKKNGTAKKALVVVPASLRENFVDNLKRYTNSSYSVYGPKGESSSKDIGEKSDHHYNVVSYDLFREHGDQILNDTGADTLIMDEVHKARGTEGQTYHKLKDLRGRFKNAITLTGSVVNNEPNDVVPLMDVTFTPKGHKLVSKKFFDKLFVRKDATTVGIFSPKVHIEKKLKNKAQLAKYLKGQIDYVSHQDLEKNMPKRNLEVVKVPMSEDQARIYNYSLNSVDPVTRWKIRNNLPVSQKDAKDAFSKLLQARQVSTDHGVLDETLADKNPYDYSPKVKKVIDDAVSHLEENKTNKTVIFGNLIKGQVGSVEKALKLKGIPYAKFLGMGQEGMTAKSRPKEIQDFQNGKKRLLLISGAGAEGLDLKNSTMLQMLEGHYNPERIQQAESRVRRMGSMMHLPEGERQVTIKRYMSVPKPPSLLQKIYAKAGYGGDGGVDDWVYTIAKRKDDLNSDFRDTLQANHEKVGAMSAESKEIERMGGQAIASFLSPTGRSLGELLVGTPVSSVIERRGGKRLEQMVKQKLLDRGYESLTQKKHTAKVMSESKIDERALDAALGAGSLMTGLGIIHAISPGSRFTKYLNKGVGSAVVKPVSKSIHWLLKNKVKEEGFKGGLARLSRDAMRDGSLANVVAKSVAAASLIGAAAKPVQSLAKGKTIEWALNSREKDFDTGIKNYLEKLRKKNARKYVGSKNYINEYETKQEFGIDDPT